MIPSMMDDMIIRQYRWYFSFLPISKNGFTTFLNQTVYVNKKIYAEILKGQPSPVSIAVLKHQEVHVKNAGIKKLFFI